MTSDNKTLIGKGGFGAVYYGKLMDGEEVAVKIRSADSKQGSAEFLNEVRYLNIIHEDGMVLELSTRRLHINSIGDHKTHDVLREFQFVNPVMQRAIAHCSLEQCLLISSLIQVRLLCKLHHRNLVRLIGYCLEGREQVLVYDYMSQGSLANHLYPSGYTRGHISTQTDLSSKSPLFSSRNLPS